MTRKTFDPKCYELAKAFLSDREGHFGSQIDELAYEIQVAIDDYIALNVPDPGRHQVDVQ
jgi:hypothetical protein